jgi:hypothetical protein
MDFDDELTILQEQFKNEIALENVKILKKSCSPKESKDKLHSLTIPETITSNDDLFGDIVTQVVEKNLDSDSEEEMPNMRLLSVAGFPVVTKRIILSQSQDPQTDSLEAASSMCQSGTRELEDGKLEWISAATIPKSQQKVVSETVLKKSLRFGFRGEILFQTMTDFACDPELYHHGDDPDKAGYTIDELNILAKSTFSSQRVVAFNTLANILKKVQMHEYEQRALDSEVLSLFYEENILFSARVGLDSNHETVIDSALNLMAVYFGVNSAIIDVFDEVLLLEKGFRTISLNRTTIRHLLNASHAGISAIFDRSEQEEENIDMTLEYIQSALRKDSMFGIVLTNILPRFRFLLASKSISPSQIMKIMHILSCVAMHSPSCAEDILACDGMVDALKSLALNCISDYFKDELMMSILTMISRLFRLISVASKESCLAIFNDGIVDMLITCLSLNPMNANMCKQVILLIDICFCYSIGASLLDKYHTLIFACFYAIVQNDIIVPTQNNPLLSESSRLCPTNDSLSFVAATSKMLTDVILHFGNDASVGGANDMIYPFMCICSQLIDIEVFLESP